MDHKEFDSMFRIVDMQFSQASKLSEFKAADILAQGFVGSIETNKRSLWRRIVDPHNYAARKAIDKIHRLRIKYAKQVNVK